MPNTMFYAGMERFERCNSIVCRCITIWSGWVLRGIERCVGLLALGEGEQLRTLCPLYFMLCYAYVIMRLWVVAIVMASTIVGHRESLFALFAFMSSRVTVYSGVRGFYDWLRFVMVIYICLTRDWEYTVRTNLTESKNLLRNESYVEQK